MQFGGEKIQSVLRMHKALLTAIFSNVLIKIKEKIIENVLGLIVALEICVDTYELDRNLLILSVKGNLIKHNTEFN